MKIGVIMQRYLPSHQGAIMPEVVQLLREWGARVDIICPDEQLTDMTRVRVNYDLYILKTKTDLSLSLAGILHTTGAIILNSYPVSTVLRDKIMTTQILQAAGVPIPQTYVAAHPRQLAPLLEDGPLVVKPYRGSQGRGVRVVRSSAQLETDSTGSESVFAQRYHEPDGHDHKIYCIGGQIFGVRRPWPVRTYEEKVGQPFTITPELREITQRCGQAFGIDLYGVDVVVSAGRPYVVDISSFPGFKGVPNAALRLADYIYAAAHRTIRGETLFPVTERLSVGLEWAAPAAAAAFQIISRKELVI
ncbi:MAG: ATP-grasp domain-containing protein [Anaerolineae bacterium]